MQFNHEFAAIANPSLSVIGSIRGRKENAVVDCIGRENPRERKENQTIFIIVIVAVVNRNRNLFYSFLFACSDLTQLRPDFDGKRQNAGLGEADRAQYHGKNRRFS